MLTIITNGHSRDILCWEELTVKEQSEFDWIEGASFDYSFFRYKDEVYCLSEFMAIRDHPNEEFSSWDGYMSDSYFSGVLVKYPQDDFNDGIIVGWYY